MLSPQWLFRMRRWVDKPPSMRTVIMVFSIIAVCVVIFLAERYGLLPDWMAAERPHRGRLPPVQ